MAKKPTTVWYVETVPHEDEPRGYRAPRRVTRLYGAFGWARSFITANPRRQVTVWRADVEWVEVDPKTGLALRRIVCADCGSDDLSTSVMDGVEYDWCNPCGTEVEAIVHPAQS